MNRLKKSALMGLCLVMIFLLNACEKKEESPFSAQGTYFVFNNRIHFYDEQANRTIPLCFKADCDHKSKTCDAYVTTEVDFDKPDRKADCLLGKVWNYQEHIYMVERNDNYFLEQYDLRGNNKREVARLNPEGTFVGMGGLGYQMEVIGDYLYYLVAVPRTMVDDTVAYPEDDTAGFDRDTYRYYIQLYRVGLEPGSAIEEISEKIRVYSSGMGADKHVLINGNEEQVTLVVCNMSEFGDYGLEGYRCRIWTYEKGQNKAQKVAEFQKESENFQGEMLWDSTSCVTSDGTVYFGTRETKTLEASEEQSAIFRIYAYSPKENSFSKIYETEEEIKISDKGNIVGMDARTFWADGDELYVYEGTSRECCLKVFDSSGKQKDSLAIDAVKVSFGKTVDAAMRRIGGRSGYIIVGMALPGIRGMELSKEAEESYKFAIGLTGFACAGIIDKSCIGTGKLEIRKIAEYPFAK